MTEVDASKKVETGREKTICLTKMTRKIHQNQVFAHGDHECLPIASMDGIFLTA